VSCSAWKNPQRIPVNTPPVFPGLRPCIWPHLLRLVTNAMSDRLLVLPPTTRLLTQPHAHHREVDGILPRRFHLAEKVYRLCCKRCDAFFSDIPPLPTPLTAQIWRTSQFREHDAAQAFPLILPPPHFTLCSPTSRKRRISGTDKRPRSQLCSFSFPSNRLRRTQSMPKT